MACIIQMPNGKWRAMIRRAGFKQESKTLPTKSAVVQWARNRETEMDRGLVGTSTSKITVRQLIEAYRNLRGQARPISDSGNEHYMLKALDRGLGKLQAAKVTVDDLVAFATMRKEEGAGPYTVNMDLSKLGTVYRYGGAALKAVLPDVVGTARPTLTYLRLIGGGGRRDRRPTEDEFDRLIDLFTEQHPRFVDAVLLAAVTAFRRGEITEIKWTDIDEKTKMVKVWRKHPRKGKVLKNVPLLPEAWAIVQRQARNDERVFPFSGNTLSKYFTDACRELGIPDLHFHDLRHEGASSLLEQGFSESEAMLITGHDDPRHFKRYTNLRPEQLHKVHESIQRRITPPR